MTEQIELILTLVFCVGGLIFIEVWGVLGLVLMENKSFRDVETWEEVLPMPIFCAILGMVIAILMWTGAL